MNTDSKGATVYTLTNNTTGRAWNYNSEAQLKTATRLFAVQNPTASLSVTIGSQTFKVR